jgi:hypothetical protein
MIEKLNDLAPLMEMATTLGRVQVECAQESRSTVGLQTLEPADLINAFRECIEGIEPHFDAWTHDDGRSQRAKGFPGDQVLAKLDTLQPLPEGLVECWLNPISSSRSNTETVIRAKRCSARMVRFLFGGEDAH